MKAYINHFALNLAASLVNLWYAFIPPQWTGHSKADIANLRLGSPWKAFLEGFK